MRIRHSILITVVWAMLIAPLVEGREKTDLIVLSNGNTITGEIKKLYRGILDIKPHYSKGLVRIEWLYVEHITSLQLFEIETEAGRRLIGTMQSGETAGVTDVSEEVGSVMLKHSEIVRMTPIEREFWDRAKGSIAVGLTGRAANHQVDLSIGGKFSYRTPGYSIEGALNSLVSTRNDAEETTRWDLKTQANRYFKRKYFYQGYVGLENNSELDLDLRAALGAGVGRYLVQSNRSLVSVLAGLSANQERYGNVDDASTNFEAALAFDYQVFLFTGHKTDLTVSLVVLPSISSWGRVRSNLATGFRHELISDFYLNLSLFASSDSEPPGESPGFDWSFVSSLGYSW